MLEEIKGLVLTSFDLESSEDFKRWERADNVVFQDYEVNGTKAIAVTDSYRLMLWDLEVIHGGKRLFGATCLCNDFIFRRRLVSIPAKPCKHLYALYKLFHRERGKGTEARRRSRDPRLKALLEIMHMKTEI